MARALGRDRHDDVGEAERAALARIELAGIGGRRAVSWPRACRRKKRPALSRRQARTGFPACRRKTRARTRGRQRQPTQQSCSPTRPSPQSPFVWTLRKAPIVVSSFASVAPRAPFLQFTLARARLDGSDTPVRLPYLGERSSRIAGLQPVADECDQVRADRGFDRKYPCPNVSVLASTSMKSARPDPRARAASRLKVRSSGVEVVQPAGRGLKSSSRLDAGSRQK